MTEVSIIIVNWNGKEDTADCLNSIYKSSYKDFEAIVVDNASKDSSVGFLRKKFPQAKIISHNKNAGPVGGFNIGMHYAQGKYICLLGNDTIVDKNWLSELVRAIKKDKRMAIVGSKIKNLVGYHGHETCGEILNLFFQVIEVQYEIKQTSFAPACSFIFRRDLFEKEPFITEYFGNCEDVYLSVLAKLKNLKIGMNPKSMIIHKGGASVSKVPTIMDFHMEKNTILNFLILYEKSTILKMLPMFIMFHLFTIISAIPRRRTLSKLKTYLWVITNRNLILKYRKLIKSQRKIPDNELIRISISYKLPIPGLVGSFFSEIVKLYLYIVGIKTIDMK